MIQGPNGTRAGLKAADTGMVVSQMRKARKRRSALVVRVRKPPVQMKESHATDCCSRAVATVTEIRDPVVDDHSLTISSPCPSVLSAGGRERTSAHRAPIRLVPERQLACRARVPARATLPGRGAPRVQLLGHPRAGRPPPAQPYDTRSDTLRLRPILLSYPLSLPGLHGSPRASGGSEREPPAPSWSPRSRVPDGQPRHASAPASDP